MIRPIGTSVTDPAPFREEDYKIRDDSVEETNAVPSALPRRPASRDRFRPKRSNSRSKTPPAPPTLTRLNGLALILSLQVGAGIFSATSLISQQVSSPAEGLAVFVTAGLLVWTGAASFVELGLLVPSNGGIQDYLRASWGDAAGHLFAWTWIIVVKPAGNAVISSIFADYLLKAAAATATGLGPPSLSGQISQWTPKIVALGCVTVLTTINCLGARSGVKAANAFVMLKLTALGSIVLIGLTTYLLGRGDGVPASPNGWYSGDSSRGTTLSSSSSSSSPLEQQQQSWLGQFSTAVLTSLFCYGGWESVGFITGDLERPEKDLPVVINGAMALVIIGFFLMNASLYVCLPFDMIRESRTVAVDFANRTIGSWGGLMFSLAVAISAMGAANANMFAIGKLSVAAAQRAYFPPVLANMHCGAARDEASHLARALLPLPAAARLPALVLARLTRRLRWEHSVPVFALLLNWVLTSVFIMVGSFTGLITLIEIVKSFCYMMSVIGLFKLRRRMKAPLPNASHHHHHHHPPHTIYRTWTFNPVIFASMSSLLVIRGIATTTLLQAPVFLLIGTLGLAVLYRRRTSGSGSAPAVYEIPLLPV